MAALRKLFGKDKNEDPEEEEDAGLDEVIRPEGSESPEGQGGIGSGIGISPDSKEGRIGGNTEMKEKINRNEERLNEVQTTSEQLSEDVSKMDERLEGLEDDISQLLDVYEMVTAQINPFLDNKPPSDRQSSEREGVSGMMQGRGLGDLEETQKEQKRQQRGRESEGTGMKEAGAKYPEELPMGKKGTPPKTAEKIKGESETSVDLESEESLRSPDDIYEEIESGNIYLLKTESPVLGYEVLKQALDNGEKVLCITRKHPGQIEDGFRLEGSDFVWLSSSTDSYAVRPNQLDALGLKIERFISEEGGTILLDGMAYLFSNNPDSTLLHFIQSIQDQVTVSQTALILPVNLNSIEDKHLGLIKNELDLKEISLQEKETEEKMGDQKMEREGSEEMVSDMEEMVDYLVKEEKELEKKVEQEAEDSTEKEEKGPEESLIIEAIEELKEEIKDLKQEIKEKKEGSKEEDAEEVEEEEEQDIHPAEGAERISEPQEAPEPTAEEDLEKEVEEVEKEVEEEVEELRKGGTERTIPEAELEEMIEEEFEEVGLPHDELTRQFVKDIVKAFQKKREIEEGIGPTSETKVEGPKELGGELKGDISSKEKLTIKEDAVIEGDLESDDSVLLEEGVQIKGDITSLGDVTIGRNCTIEGDVVSESGRVEIGSDSTIKGRVEGTSVELSTRVKIQEISAEDRIVIGRDSRVDNATSKGSVEVKDGVRIEGTLEYGKSLSLDGSDIVLVSGVHPIKSEPKLDSEKGEHDEEEKEREKEVVSERWVSQ